MRALALILSAQLAVTACSGAAAEAPSPSIPEACVSFLALKEVAPIAATLEVAVQAKDWRLAKELAHKILDLVMGESALNLRVVAKGEERLFNVLNQYWAGAQYFLIGVDSVVGGYVDMEALSEGRNSFDAADAGMLLAEGELAAAGYDCGQ